MARDLETIKVTILNMAMVKIIILACLMSAVAGLQNMPLYQIDSAYMQAAGNENNATGPIEVHISIAVERLINIDLKNSKFAAVLNVVLSWRDPVAKLAVLEDTRADLNGTRKCSYRCSPQSYPGAPCCDRIFAPYFYFGNEMSSSELQSRIVFGDKDEVIKVVKVKGEFYQRISMQSYPFGSTQLLMQISFYDNAVRVGLDPSLQSGDIDLAKGRLVEIRPSGASSSVGGASGRGSSQWKIKDSKIAVIDDASSLKNVFFARGDQALSSEDPLSDVLISGEARTGNQLLVQSRVIFSMVVEQNWQIGFVSSVLPLILLSCMTVIILLQSVNALNSRISGIIGMFFTLTNIQSNTLSSNPSSEDMTPIQAASFVLYTMLFITMLESVLVSKVADFHCFFRDIKNDLKISVHPKINPDKFQTTSTKELYSSEKEETASSEEQHATDAVSYKGLKQRLLTDENYCMAVARTIDRVCFFLWIAIFVISYVVIAATTDLDNYVVVF